MGMELLAMDRCVLAACPVDVSMAREPCRLAFGCLECAARRLVGLLARQPAARPAYRLCILGLLC